MTRFNWLICTALLAVCAAQAATLSYTGTFLTDDQTEQFLFDVVGGGSVELRTWSYAGGVNAEGTTIAPGGFDPYLSVFEVTGLQLLLALNEDRAGVCGVDNAADPVSGTCFDAGLQLTLTPGRYLAVLSQSGNPPLGPTLADGFQMTGAGNYTGGPFLDVLGNQRNGEWALDITGEVREAPEPSALLMFFGGGLMLFAISRRNA